MIQAAAKSASRTAQLADAGDWQDDEVYEPPASSTPTSSTRILAGVSLLWRDASCS